MKTKNLSLKKEIPKNLQGILWSISVDKLDLEQDKVYIINQVLVYGTLEQIHWLFEVYGAKTIKEIFTSKPLKIYTPQTFSFIKNIILDLKNASLNKDRYVKSIS